MTRILPQEERRTNPRVEVGETNLPSDLVEAYLNREVKESRRHLKAVILLLAPKRRVQPACIKEYGPAGGVLLAHLFRWDSRGADENGWIYQSAEQIQELSGLGEHVQRKARKRLVAAGVLEEELRKGIPQRLFYRVDLGKVLGLFQGSTARELAELEAAYLDQRADDAFVCNGEFCFGCDECEGWIRGEDEPLTEDEPLIEDVPLDWLPEDFVPTLNLDSISEPLLSDSTPSLNHRTQPRALTLADKQRGERIEGRQRFHVQRGEGHFRAPSPEVDLEEREHEQSVATSPPTQQDSPGSDMAEEVKTLPTSPVITTHAPAQTARQLLEPGGKLHDYALIGLTLENGAEMMANHVADVLDGKPADYVDEVSVVLREIATTTIERSVA